MRNKREAVAVMLKKFRVPENSLFHLIVDSIVDEIKHIPTNQEDAAIQEVSVFLEKGLELMAKTAGVSLPEYVSRRMSSSDRKEQFTKIVNNWKAQRRGVKDVLNALCIPKDIPCRKILIVHFNSELGIVPRVDLEKTMFGILDVAKRHIGADVLQLEEATLKEMLSKSIRTYRQEATLITQ